MMKKNFIRLFVLGMGLVVCNQALAPPSKRMHVAAMSGSIDRVKEELAKGVDVNLKDSGYTALMYAVLSGNANLVEILLKKEGIDVNLKGRLGRTALMLAVWNRKANLVEILLKAEGIDVNLKDNNGKTALGLVRGYPEAKAKMMEMLKAAGATEEASRGARIGGKKKR